ncbi:MAG: Maf family protein [Pseudomonadota bacterium]
MTTASPPTHSSQTTLVLASASPSRAALLGRLADAFEQQTSHVDETPRPAELPATLAARLAREKCEAVSSSRKSTDEPLVVIGADQVAGRDGTRLGKPGNAKRNVSMLRSCSGKTVVFYSAVHIIDTRSGRSLSHTDITRVRFRTLSADEISHYVDHEKPWQCAGGFKVEGRGISLFEIVESTDPTGLIGLPLIFVSKALRTFDLC